MSVPRPSAGTSGIHDFLAEALNDLFAKHGKPEIAPLESMQ